MRRGGSTGGEVNKSPDEDEGKSPDGGEANSSEGSKEGIEGGGSTQCSTTGSREETKSVASRRTMAQENPEARVAPREKSKEPHQAGDATMWNKLQKRAHTRQRWHWPKQRTVERTSDSIYTLFGVKNSRQTHTEVHVHRGSSESQTSHVRMLYNRRCGEGDQSGEIYLERLHEDDQ